MAERQLPDGVHTVELVVGDNYGILRGKRVPSAMWEHVAETGTAMANAIFVWSPRCEIRDESPYATMATGFPDIHLVPLPDTMRPIPWRPGSSLVLCRAIEEDGGPVQVDPREALLRVLARCEEMGYQAKVGFEIEFFLLDPETRRPRDTDIQCYGISRGSEYEPVAAPIRNLLTEFGIPIEASNNEYASGQFEVNIRYGDALATADNAVLFRNAVKEVAWQHGWLASFMAKPFAEESGNGLHLHQSLWDGDRNIFADGGKLSEVGRWYLGGLREHMCDLTVLGSPTPNALKRRSPYSFCPINNAWGMDNRTVGLRVIESHGRDSAVRIEQRDGSADCNPYLIMAGQIAAGLSGIAAQREPGPMCAGDAYTNDEATPLPVTIPHAVELFGQSRLVKDTFDETLIELVTAAAMFEHELFATTVSDVERDRYLDVF